MYCYYYPRSLVAVSASVASSILLFAFARDNAVPTAYGGFYKKPSMVLNRYQVPYVGVWLFVIIDVSSTPPSPRQPITTRIFWPTPYVSESSIPIPLLDYPLLHSANAARSPSENGLGLSYINLAFFLVQSKRSRMIRSNER